MAKELLNKTVFRYIFIILLIAFLFLCYYYFDLKFVSKLIATSEHNTYGEALLPALIVFILRSISIVIPVIPGTYCAVILGYLYGIELGLLIVFVADFLSCSSSFFISRRFGRGFVRKLLGVKQMKRVEKISQQYLERNFFLMTAFLMTSWFDFVCYAVGLTKILWRKFLPALVISIIISDLPFVAGGYTLSGLQGVSINQILNGEVKVIEGPYLMVLIISALLIFFLAFLNIFLTRRKSNP